MILGQSNSFFSQNAQSLLLPDFANKTTMLPFKDHPQFPLMTDIFSRKFNHHLLLNLNFSPLINVSFIEAFLFFLKQHSLPKRLAQAEILLMELNREFYLKEEQKKIEQDFQRFRQALDMQDKYVIIALMQGDAGPELSHFQLPLFLKDLLQTLMTHSRCRLLMLNNHHNQPIMPATSLSFSSLTISPPSEKDVLILLKKHKHALEKFHHVSVPDALIDETYFLANRYLSTSQAFKQCLLLLDSSAAKESIGHEKTHHRPALKLATVLDVLSAWTEIPSSYLHTQIFSGAAFIQGMQQSVFGQELALQLISDHWEKSHPGWQLKSNRICHFLFAGPPHSGKKTVVAAFVQQLFHHQRALFNVSPHSFNQNKLSDVMVTQHETRQRLPLKELVSTTPHAVILFDELEKLNPFLFSELLDLLKTGILHEGSQQYDFNQATFIFTTTLGARSLTTLVQSCILDVNQVGLMDVLFNEKEQAFHSLSQYFSAEETIDAMMPDLRESFPEAFCHEVNLIPFLPLNNETVEKIIRSEVDKLTINLLEKEGVELMVAPEVIHYLLAEALHYEAIQIGSNSLITAFKLLHTSIAQTIQHNKRLTAPLNRLFLQLNDTGQLLHCEWQACAEVV